MLYRVTIRYCASHDTVIEAENEREAKTRGVTLLENGQGEYNVTPADYYGFEAEHVQPIEEPDKVEKLAAEVNAVAYQDHEEEMEMARMTY